MTDVQIPLQHQNHQKAMNGKYSPKNLEMYIRSLKYIIFNI